VGCAAADSGHPVIDNSTQGVAISSRQAKDARLANGLRRRNNDPVQHRQQRQDTHQAIAEALFEGTRF